MEHVTIFYDQEQFAAWPFAHGLWAWPDGEVLVGFSRSACAYGSPADVNHIAVDTTPQYVTIRSSDGGRTWPSDGVQILAEREPLIDDLVRQENVSDAAAEPTDWTAPDFCLTSGFGIPPADAKHIGYIQHSCDRGRSWQRPSLVPPLGFWHVQVKPDYVIRPDGKILLFVTVGRASASPDAKNPGRFSSRFVAVYASPDSGRTWRYLSAIQPGTPDGPFIERYYASPVLLPDGRIVAALRCQLDGANGWPEFWESADEGWTWRFICRIADWGAPTDLLRLRDGRLLAVYGYRAPPYGIRAKVSDDDGRTWGPELVLRDDGGSLDLGYPRVVELADGSVLAAYYFNRADDQIQCEGGVRHIAGTFFTP